MLHHMKHPGQSCTAQMERDTKELIKQHRKLGLTVSALTARRL